MNVEHTRIIIRYKVKQTNRVFIEKTKDPKAGLDMDENLCVKQCALLSSY